MEIVITNTNGQLTTSSLGVAETFGKQHKNVIRDIENLISEVGGSKLSRPLFIENTYQHPQNKQIYKCYDMTRDGFSLLVMGFTGKKALEWKIKYIEAFNRMEQALRTGYSSLNIERIITETIEKTTQALIPYLMVGTIVKNRKNTECLSYRIKSKMSQLPAELVEQVDDMLERGASCQAVADFITEKTGMKISQMAVNRYRRKNFKFNGEV